MRVRLGLLAMTLAVALAAALTACTGDDPEPSSEPSEAPMSEITVPCPEFEEASQKIAEAQTAIYSGGAGTETIDDLVAELDGLKDGAPEDVQDALTAMGEAFRDAAEILENPSPENQQRLADLAPQLADDSQKITEYVQSQCD